VQVSRPRPGRILRTLEASERIGSEPHLSLINTSNLECEITYPGPAVVASQRYY
jgi:hypothetical protein